MITRISILASLFALACSACGAGAEAEQRSAELAETIHAHQVEHFVRTFALTAPSRAVELAERNARTPSIGTMIEEGRLDFETDPAIRELVTLLFAERGYEHLFVYGTHLTPDGRAVVETLLEADREGLNPADFHSEGIEERVGLLAAAGDIDDIVNALQLSVEDESELLAFMMSEAALDGTLPAADAVFSLIAAESANNPVPRYSGAIEDLSQRLASAAQAAPELELVLAAGFLRYAIRNRHSNLEYVDEELALSHGWGDVNDHREEAERTQAGASFRAALSSGFSAELAQLRPQFGEYDELVDALADYRRYVDAGGWERIEVDHLEPGDNDESVAALRGRLAAEGYFSGDLESFEYDSELEAAVEWYQQTHQLVEDGEVAGGTLWSLNVPAERRVSQILVALDKWRETPLAADADEEYIWVNIPEFYAELRDGSELISRWKVVVGRERRGRDSLGNPRGQTPRFSDTLEYIVFNPYWNVPNQIRVEEYEPQIAADPNWLADNGFEIAVDGSREWLRQMPGPGNALGQVKFLFPNQHDVYMHDTPSRQYFERPVRNYSHGCVRVHEPLELAAVLLERDRDWEPSRARRYVERMLEQREEQWLSLVDPLPVHLVYVSVAVDDDGRPNFLADPYALDRPLVDEKQAEYYPDSIELEEE